ncbi:MAG: hypothetical protein K6F54_05660 [Lachnospiraceae bacterium]|nr:hypothetical protein [Lachnospiraceae bacterium]
MDGKQLFEQDQKRKSVSITESGIQVDKSEQEERLKRIMTIPNMDMPMPEMQGRHKEENRQDNKNADKESVISGIPIEENRALIEEGRELFEELNALGGVKEKEIILDNINGIDALLEQPVRATQTRLNRFENMRRLIRKDAIRAAALLRNSRSLVKKGNFSREQIDAGREFIRKINEWAGIDQEPEGDEGKFYNKLGKKDTLEFLYVDGKPLKQFVADKYGYRGSRDKHTERGVLSAYVAMIAARQNHPITLVRPVIVNGVADVDIRNVGVDMRTPNQGREAQIKGLRYAIEGDRYREYCETAYRSDMRAEAGNALRSVKGKQIEGLKTLENLKRALSSTEKGKHKNYDDFVRSFNMYFDALEFICLDPEHMDVTKEDLRTLYKLNETALSCAAAYLKGKKMNLGRHNVIKDIRSALSAQSGNIWGVLRSGILDERGKTVSLKDIIDRKEEGFVVMGIEEEVGVLKEKQSENDQDKNEYSELSENIGLPVSQKTILRMKNRINQDEATKRLYTKLVTSVNDKTVSDDVRLADASQFLKAAASTLLMDEKYGAQLRRRYDYAADNTELLLNATARDQLRKAYADDFKSIPALQTALEMWNEEVASQEAAYLSYSSNRLGDQVSRKDFIKTGGACDHQYVSRSEGAGIVNASHGYMAVRNVKGRDNVVELVPTLPEFKTLDSGKPTEKQIPLRNTVKTVFRTFIAMMTGEDGKLKKVSEAVGNMKAVDWMDTAIKSSKMDAEDINNLEIFFRNNVRPEMVKLLTEEYKKKGISGAKSKAQLDADTYCRSYLDLLKTNDATLATKAFDVSFSDFLYRVKAVKDTDIDTLMNHKDFKKILINGQAPTREEVREVMDEFKAEISQNEDEFIKIGKMDNDDPAVMSFTSCNDNAQLFEALMALTPELENEEHSRVDYSYTDRFKQDPNKTLDFIIANMDNLKSLELMSDKAMQRNIDKMHALDEKRKTQELTKEDAKDIWFFAKTYSKYEWHRGANICKVGNTQYTVETYANQFDEIFQAPLTRNISVGKYTSDKENQKDDDGFVKNAAMKEYYDHDDAFSSVRTKKQILRTRLKEIYFKIADKEKYQ